MSLALRVLKASQTCPQKTRSGDDDGGDSDQDYDDIHDEFDDGTGSYYENDDDIHDEFDDGDIDLYLI